MSYTKHNKQAWVTKLPILVVYLLFFTVQILFNLDTTQQPFAVQGGTLYSSQCNTLHVESFKKSVDHTPLKSNIRLNKRFQPSHTPCIISTIVEVPAVYIEPLQIGTYKSIYYSSAILYTPSLRGPPVVG